MAPRRQEQLPTNDARSFHNLRSMCAETALAL